MMTSGGLVKLLEELGELSQIAAKKITYINTDNHPDGKGSMKIRLEEEMGDVWAAIQFVAEKFQLSLFSMDERARRKLALFREWDKEER